MSFRILLVEDEESILEAVKLNLELENYAVTTAESGTEGLELFTRQSFDLVVLDVMLPGMDGFEVCKNIRIRDQHTPILFLTAKNYAQDRIEGLKIGGDDYLAKPFHLEELLLRIQLLLRKKSSPGPQATEVNTYAFGANSVNFKTFEIQGLNGLQKQLSRKEIGLLRLLIERKNEVVSRKEILDTVWGYDQYPSERTIDNFISGFRKYFEEQPRNPQFFHSVRGVGYKFSDQQ